MPITLETFIGLLWIDWNLVSNMVHAVDPIPLRHGCPNPANVSNTLDSNHFLDAAICPGANRLTLPIYGSLIVMGVINIPMYIRTDSIAVPLVVTVIAAGVLIQFVSSIFQLLFLLVIIFVFGLGPIAIIKRFE